MLVAAQPCTLLKGCLMIKCVKLLLESGADMNIRQNNGTTPFDY